ncbi:MAG: cytochrome c oxidase subunit II [Chthoniobacter sp.]|nr:cytochrome c oxidase subunit II [Chthoniobacter sp.]
MTALLGVWFLPERASDLAVEVDALFYGLLILCGLITAGVCGAVTIFCIRYRQGSTAIRQAEQKPMVFEIVWSAIPLVIFIVIFIFAGAVYFHMSKPPDNAVEIHVVGKQWMWKVQHPTGRREINELHLLVNQPVKLLMTSQDVIHDVFVPAFRTKQDVLPGRYTVEWFTPTKPGHYHLFCAEYCGTDHSRMGGWVHVLDPDAYAKWLGDSSTDESVVAAGARLFQARGCAGCHAPNATVHAPPLNGIYRHPVALATGQTVIADEQYIHDSILQPRKDIVAGYPDNIMPTYQGQLGEEEVMQLIAYIKALGSTSGGVP